MKSNPKVVTNIVKNVFGVSINLMFDNNLTLLIGNSGNGKSFIFQILDELKTYDDQIETFNYRDLNKFHLDTLKSLKGKLIVIDNADILLDLPKREYIAFDDTNQYLIIGRDPSDLMITLENFKRVKFDEDTKTLSLSSLPLI